MISYGYSFVHFYLQCGLVKLVEKKSLKKIYRTNIQFELVQLDAASYILKPNQ